MSFVQECQAKSEGATYSQPLVLSDVLRVFDKHHREATGQPLSVIPRQVNRVIECVNLMIAEFQKPFQQAEANCGLAAWLASDEVGRSSKALAAFLSGGKSTIEYYPLDGGDFRRCVVMLRAVPELRSELHRVMTQGPYWTALLGHWTELEALVDTDQGELTARMTRIYEPIDRR